MTSTSTLTLCHLNQDGAVAWEEASAIAALYGMTAAFLADFGHLIDGGIDACDLLLWIAR